MKFAQVAVAVLVVGCFFISAFADEPQEGSETPSLWERETLTNDWFGLGRKLSEQGLTVSLGLTQVYQQNLRGALSTHRHAGRYSGRYDLEVEADLETLLGWSGGHVYGLARGGWSDGLDDSSIGSLFGVNAVAVGDRPIDIWQLYFEQALWNYKFFVRVGKIDLTGGFECRGCPGSFDGSSFANDEATQFFNGGLVNNSTIPFPDPGLGVMLHLEPVEWWYISAAVADADADVRETGFNTTFHGPDNFFSIFETGVLPRLPSRKGPLQGAYRVGLWYVHSRRTASTAATSSEMTWASISALTRWL
jgi:carbohydrate-selective porin OprB